MALDYLACEHRSQTIDLGNMRGFSVLETIEMVKQVSGVEFEVRRGQRRGGDPPELVGSTELAREVLGWEPQYRDLEDIVRHAWTWHCKEAGVEPSRSVSRES